MTTVKYRGAVTGFCFAFLFTATSPVRADHPQPLPVTVSFQQIDFIHTGKLANFTGLGQLISFRVFPSRLINTQTNEDLLLGSPDAFFAVKNAAFADESIRATEYCLDILRSMAVNPTSGAELSLFLRVTHVTGTNFVVNRFDGCALVLR